MKKKIAVILMVSLLTAALTACGRTAGGSSSGSADTAAMTTEVYDDAETDTGYAEDVYEESEEVATADDSSGSEVSESAVAENRIGDGEESESAENEAAGTDEDSSYEQKLIRTVNLDVETTEFDALITQLETKIEELGGYVESSETNTSSAAYYGRWSSMTIRIPADSLDEFVSLVGENANVTYTSESTEDVTLTYVDLESHLTALRTEQESLLSMLEAAETVEDIISIQSRLTEVRYEIESYESQLRVYDNKVNYSTVYLYIDEVERETAAADETFWGSVGTKFSDNVYRLGQGFRNFVIGFLGALPIILVIVVPAAVILLIINCAVKRRQKKLEKSFEEIEVAEAMKAQEKIGEE
ncbi:MAG: DUF4349 domain-containing protein [Clostridiales bacterium]|nr:DUF4349 domain-containing protein [Clostridiales bacterium]